MIVELPIEPALAYIRDRLAAAGGFGALLLSKPMRAPFAVAGPRATAQQLVEFQWGHDWASLDANPVDANSELVRCLPNRVQPDWWAIYLNVWARKGDLHPQECGLPDFILFDGSYCHLGEKCELPFKDWYMRKVGFGMIIVLVSQDPRRRVVSSGEEISKEIAVEIAETATAVVVTAYDDEGWVGAEVG